MDSSLPLILASGSAGRRWLMDQAGIPFSIRVSSVKEPESGFTHPASMVNAIAWLKARAVAAETESGRIIAADTIAWIDGKPLLKPTDRMNARDMMNALQGRIHELWTGVVIWDKPQNHQYSWQECSLVRIRPMNGKKIEEYLDTRIWGGCSGSYAIDGERDPVVQVVRGSVSNIVGLPMESLTQVLNWLSQKKLAHARNEQAEIPSLM